MDSFILAVVSVGLVGSSPVPHYPLYNVYVAPRHLHHPAVFAPLPPHHHTAPVTTNDPAQALLVHNWLTYNANPEPESEDVQNVAQYYSQDAGGRVVFGFIIPNQTRLEARSTDGTVRGSYTYKDPTGKTVRMQYWDSGAGFHMMGNNLPTASYSPPQYTPEVQAARDRHLQLYREALHAALASGSVDEYEEPQPLPNNPAVSVVDAAADSHQTEELPAMPDYDADSDAVEIDSADDYPYLRQAHAFRSREPEAARKQVAQVEVPVSDLMLDTNSQLVIARTGVDGFQYLVPVGKIGKLSESQHAQRYGAIPVAAVHDAQVSPAQSQGIDNHQVKPILVRTGAKQAKSY